MVGVSTEPVTVCFVCLGNICRSPTAEALLRRRLEDRGVGHLVVVESAGTGDWHVGDPPDPRARAEGHRRGIAVDGAARQFQPEDFQRFEMVLAMDRNNAADLRILAPDDASAAKVRLLREFDPAADGLDVPDPYYGGEDHFAETFEIVDRAVEGLILHLHERGLPRP